MLEIGGGVGQVALELLKAGAASAEVVELLPALRAARPRARAPRPAWRSGSSFRTADLVAEPSVRGARRPRRHEQGRLLHARRDRARRDRRLARASDARAQLPAPGLVGAGRPRDVNLYLRLRRRRFRVFVHPQAALEGAVEAHGLARVSERNGPLFRIAAFERV